MSEYDDLAQDAKNEYEAEMAHEKDCIRRCEVSMKSGQPCWCGYH